MPADAPLAGAPIADAHAYSKFARFYDEVMGDRSADVDRVRNYIARYHPSATTLLEVGSGTGPT